MKRVISKSIAILLFVGILLGAGIESVSAQNTISGLVFDNSRRPVSTIEVQLLDNFERFVKRTQTNGSGLYFFPNLRAGIYYVSVSVFGTNFKKVKIRIDLGASNRTVQTGSGSRTRGVEIKQQDVYLQIDPQRINKDSNDVTGVIFAQEIPADAKDFYEKGLQKLKNKNELDGIKSFEKALQIFPTYFNALIKSGEIYLNQKKYIEAENTFTKATEINNKSFVGFFNLAIAQYKQDKKAEAIESLKEANAIDGNSINSHLLLGIIQRKLENFNEAEKTLLKAKDLSKNKEADVNWQLAELFYFNLRKLDQAIDELNYYLKNLSKAERRNNPKNIADVKKLIKKIQIEVNQNS